MKRFISVGIVSLCIGGVSQAVTVETQNFDSAVAATAAGWTGVNNTSSPQNYDFSNSNNTGGTSPAGEAGGLFGRAQGGAGSNVKSYYADTTLGTTYSLNDAFSFSGEFVETAQGAGFNSTGGADFFVSYLNSGEPDGRRQLAGFSVSEPQSSQSQTTGFRVFPVIRLNDGTAVTSSGYFQLTQGTQYTFNFTYDPNAGTNGLGTLEFFIGNVSQGTATLLVSSGDRAIGANFDAFGLSNDFVNGAGLADTNTTFFIDGAQYTSAAALQLPEPSVIGLLASAGMLVIRRRR